MIIPVHKFGTILNGRPAGREAALVLKQILHNVKRDEGIVFDFSDVVVLTPSYADEFFRIVREDPLRSFQFINLNSPVINDSLSAIGISAA